VRRKQLHLCSTTFSTPCHVQYTHCHIHTPTYTPYHYSQTLLQSVQLSIVMCASNPSSNNIIGHWCHYYYHYHYHYHYHHHHHCCYYYSALQYSITEGKLSINKKAQLSLTNPRDAKVCQKLLQFNVRTMLSLTILTFLHSFSCCCVRNLRNPTKFTQNSNLWSSRSSKVIDLGVNRKPICDFILVINSNFSRICYRFRDIRSYR